MAKRRETYLLKIITLAVAFACGVLILLFSISEFGYDKFHRGHNAVFRLLQRNGNETYIGSRFSNKIPFDVLHTLQTGNVDSLRLARVKLLDKVNVLADHKVFKDIKCYAADPGLSEIFSFEILNGSLNEFRQRERTVILSSSVSNRYFGTTQSQGRKIQVSTFRDTVLFTVAAVYRDYPHNAHEEFSCFLRFDSSALASLHFDPGKAGIYGKLPGGNFTPIKSILDKLEQPGRWSYRVQPISEIYFGPRVNGEDARHGDRYSIIILISVAALILFLSLTSFVNLTILTLPYRSKELAIKKLAGKSQPGLTIGLAGEYGWITGISLILGVLLLVLSSGWMKSILEVDIVVLFLSGDLSWVLLLLGLFLIFAIAPLFFTLRFTRASPIRLLGTEIITFPRFKKTIIFLQLGISIFLLVASMVIKRQINYSLLKEPGRNYDQIVYVNYPEDLTNEGLARMRTTWKEINPNVIDLMATSQLPDRVSSKEIDSEFYSISVDRGFKDFFELEMIQGDWFGANDGDSIMVVNEQGKTLMNNNTRNVIGVFKGLSGQFNQPEQPIKIKVASYVNYNYLCIRVLEVDIRRTVHFLEKYFEQNGREATVSFLDKRFEEWLKYQDKLNSLSEVLAILSGLLTCLSVYGLSMGIVRDKLKQIAIHKFCGAGVINLTRLLVTEFAVQMGLAILIFGPLTYIIIKELLRNFVFSTSFIWLDPVVPLVYCIVVITLLCGFQALNLNRQDLTAALKR